MANAKAELIKKEIIGLIEEAKELAVERGLNIEDFDLDGTIDELKVVVKTINDIEIPEKENENDGQEEEEKEKESKKVVKPTLSEMLSASRKTQKHIRKEEEKDLKTQLSKIQ